MENSNKTIKTLLITFLVLSVTFFAVFAVGTCLFVNGTVPNFGQDFGQSLAYFLSLIKGAYIFPFNQSLAGDFALINGDVATTTTFSALVYVTLVLTVIGLVLGIIFVCLKKAKRYIGYSVMLIASLFVAHVLLTFPYITFVQAFAQLNQGAAIAFLLMGFIGGILCFVCTWVTYALGLVNAKKLAEPKSSVISSPVLAEEALQVEAVEEKEELPVFETTSDDKVSEASVEPEPEPEENIKEEAPAINMETISAMIKEAVRDIVRDELARNQVNQNQQPQATPVVTGATFGGPLIVQYFNGGINSAPTPVVAPEPVKKEEPKPVEPKKVQEEVKQEVVPTPEPEPVVEEVKEEVEVEQVAEPILEEAPVVEEVSAPEPVVEEAVEAPVVAPVVNENEEKKVYERLTFAERLLQSEDDVKDNYNELKNEILAYGVKSRISAVGDTFRLHKKMYVRITVAGKGLKLYFALDPKDYENSTIPVSDASKKAMYEEIPLCFKVKSGLSMRRCKDLIAAAMAVDNLEKGEVGKVNWVKEIKAELAEQEKQSLGE